MSPSRGPARPIKKIRLKVTLEGDRPLLARAGKVLKESKVEGKRLICTMQTSDPAEALQQVARIGDAVKEPSKEFK